MDRRIVNRSCCLCVALVVLLASVVVAQNTINTVAGGGPNNLPVTSSAIGMPWSVVQFKDNEANITTYITDTFSNRVFQVANGTLTVIAGNIVEAQNGATHDGFAATNATLSAPQGVAVDSSGNLYIADTGDHAIRFVNTNPAKNSVTFYSNTANPITVNPGEIQTIVGIAGTLCGDGGPVACGDRGPATSATLTSPGDVWLDSNNNIYIADTVDNVIRVVNTQASTITVAGVANIQPSTIMTIAGNYAPCSASPCGDGGAATSAQLANPAGIWLDANNNIYIADTFDQVVREVNATSGIINSIAGSYGVACPLANKNCGDGGPATAAQLNQPDGVFGDGSGNIYIADTGDQVVRAVSGGNISLVAGTYHTACSSSCGDGGPATSSELNAPTGAFLDSLGNLFIADNSDDAIREVKAPVTGANIQTAMGIILDAGYSGDAGSGIVGTPTDASLLSASYSPPGVAADAAGNLYIADSLNNVVRVVNNQTTSITVAGVTVPPGAIKTLVGNGVACPNRTCGDGGPASAAQLSGPAAVALDASGNLYILDTYDKVVRVVNTQQSTSISVGSVTIPPGYVDTVAGRQSAPPGYSGDNGPATEAQLDAPFGLGLDAAGNIYIADGNTTANSNNVIRVVNTQQSNSITVAGVSIPAGYINYVAGTPQQTCPDPVGNPNSTCGDGGAATSATLNAPTGVAVDRSGNIYIADNGDNRIRFVDNSTGLISTIAGTGASCPAEPCGDGGAASQATLYNPQNVYVDFSGTLYIADTVDNVIRAVSPAGNISTAVGSYIRGFTGDGGAATQAALVAPAGLGADSAGDLFVNDFATWRVRRVNNLVVTAPTATASPNPLVLPGAIANKETSNADINVTNNGNGTNLTVSALTVSGGNASGDFKASGCTNSAPPNGGSCTVTVSFTPSAVGSRTATLTITDNAANGQQSVPLSGAGLGATTTAMSSSANPSTVNTAVTFTATVTGTSGSDGTVTFNDGSTPLGSPVALSNGVAAINTSSLTAGTHSITAVYSGDANAFLAGSTSAALQQVVSATFKVVPITDSVSAGSPATYSISVSAQDGFSGSVTLTCLSGLPSGAACQFSPNPVALGASSTLTITTTGATASLAAPAVDHRSTPLYAIWLLLPAMLLSTTGLTAPQRKKLISYFLLALALAGLLFLLACGGSSSGGGSSGGGGGGGGGGGTPAGTYTITIQGSSGSVTAKQTVTLTVS